MLLLLNACGFRVWGLSFRVYLDLPNNPNGSPCPQRNEYLGFYECVQVPGSV